MDISHLRDRGGVEPLSVSALNQYIKALLDSTPLLSNLSVRGEISNLTNHTSGHIYFTLKDEDGQVRAVMFRSAATRLRFVPENGMKVIATGSISAYTKSGIYQLYVNSIEPDGVGALYLAYEQRRQKLCEEGLFDEEHKLPIPVYPTRIGVITSSTGAAVRDIVQVTGRRFPMATVYLYPSLVQGDGAEENLIRALRYFEESRLVDVIIIGRGGGSIEDLWAFNGEALARTIYSMTIPIVSAVGHETDYTICDFVADLRAPTPSAAAELITPDKASLLLSLDDCVERCRSVLDRKISFNRERLDYLMKNGVLSSAQRLFATPSERLRLLSSRLEEKQAALLDSKNTTLVLSLSKLEALNPLSVLARGYSVAEKDGAVIRCANDLEAGDTVSLRFSQGRVEATVNKIF